MGGSHASLSVCKPQSGRRRVREASVPMLLPNRRDTPRDHHVKSRVCCEPCVVFPIWVTIPKSPSLGCTLFWSVWSAWLPSVTP